MMMTPIYGPVQLTAFGEFLMRLHSAGSQRFLQTQEYKSFYAGAEAKWGDANPALCKERRQIRDMATHFDPLG